MNTITKTILRIDLPTKKIFVNREFAGSLEQVWSAWTKSDLLDQWWAPKPWVAKTKSMDFRKGGYWLYSMTGPDGMQVWSRADYLSITDRQSFEGLDAFCDEHGKINDDLPRMNWKVVFTGDSNKTRVDIEITFTTLADLEKIVEMGFEEGFTAAHGNLDELLK
jgi:uncharacterized protein YndB with AHSA1/START domain